MEKVYPTWTEVDIALPLLLPVSSAVGPTVVRPVARAFPPSCSAPTRQAARAPFPPLPPHSVH